MKNDKEFWGKISSFYNKMFVNANSYKKMYSLMRNSLNEENSVLELGTASGLVARAISDKVKEVYAIDYSNEMIEKAKELTSETNIFYSVQDSMSLQFEDKRFDAVIIANVLHIMERPEGCLKEIRRVLKDDGLLIAPTFMWKEKTFIGKIKQFFMLKKNFPIYFYWDSKSFIQFLSDNSFSCIKTESIKSSFNICYVECKKK